MAHVGSCLVPAAELENSGPTIDGCDTPLDGQLYESLMPKKATSKVYHYDCTSIKPQFIPPSDYCRASPTHSAEKLAEQTTGWPMPNFKHDVPKKPAGVSCESSHDREVSAKVYWTCELLIILLSFPVRQTVVAHSSRTGKVAVRGDSMCRLAADV